MALGRELREADAHRGHLPEAALLGLTVGEPVFSMDGQGTAVPGHGPTMNESICHHDWVWFEIPNRWQCGRSGATRLACPHLAWRWQRATATWVCRRCGVQRAVGHTPVEPPSASPETQR